MRRLGIHVNNDFKQIKTQKQFFDYVCKILFNISACVLKYSKVVILTHTKYQFW